ncbi:MAG: TolC family protein [Deltaproteobacteria bacterium]
MSWPSRLWSVGPSISQTVFDGGLRRAQSDQLLAAYDATTASYRQIVLTAFQEVDDNLAALRILGEEVHVQTEAVEAARQPATVTNKLRGPERHYMNRVASCLNSANISLKNAMEKE